MKNTLLWLLLLFSPLAPAADWQTWRTVGQATLSWGPFTVYDSRLVTPTGRWQPMLWPQALVITYRRNISSRELVDATREQWQAQQNHDRAQPQWLGQLAAIWPDVSDGTRLAFVADEQGGQFYWQPAGPSRAMQPLGPVFSPAFRDAFLGIWLAPTTTYPDIRRELIGG